MKASHVTEDEVRCSIWHDDADAWCWSVDFKYQYAEGSLVGSFEDEDACQIVKDTALAVAQIFVNQTR
jgi:hypothetical protein